MEDIKRCPIKWGCVDLSVDGMVLELLKQDGATYNGVARLAGIKAERVKRIMKRHDIPPIKRKHTAVSESHRLTSYRQQLNERYKQVVDAYIPGETSYNDLADITGEKRYFCYRALGYAGIIYAKPPKTLSRRGLMRQGRRTMTKEWRLLYPNKDKITFLNPFVCQKKHGHKKSRYLDDVDYKLYIEKFYHDAALWYMYDRWIESGKDHNLKPSLDHINPISNGGTHSVDNLQFITWAENRAKGRNTHEEWEYIKRNIWDYFTTPEDAEE